MSRSNRKCEAKSCLRVFRWSPSCAYTCLPDTVRRRGHTLLDHSINRHGHTLPDRSFDFLVLSPPQKAEVRRSPAPRLPAVIEPSPTGSRPSGLPYVCGHAFVVLGLRATNGEGAVVAHRFLVARPRFGSWHGRLGGAHLSQNRVALTHPHPMQWSVWVFLSFFCLGIALRACWQLLRLVRVEKSAKATNQNRDLR
jgi:hypothetical protein